MVGHSMGGNIALKLAAFAPEIIKAIVMIDTFIDGDPSFVRGLRELSENLDDIGGSRLLFEMLSAMLFLPSDNPDVKNDILAQCARTPWHVLRSAFSAHLLHGSSVADLRQLTVPAAYIGADGLPTEIWRPEEINPRVSTGKTVGVGHFAPLLAPDQINAMLSAFIGRVNASATQADAWKGTGSLESIHEPNNGIRLTVAQSNPAPMTKGMEAGMTGASLLQLADAPASFCPEE